MAWIGEVLGDGIRVPWIEADKVARQEGRVVDLLSLPLHDVSGDRDRAGFDIEAAFPESADLPSTGPCRVATLSGKPGSSSTRSLRRSCVREPAGPSAIYGDKAATWSRQRRSSSTSEIG